MIKCPLCDHELELFKNKKVCSNDSCHYVEIVSNSLKLPEWSALAANESLWVKDAFNTFPSIIAHEYKRLYELLKKNQMFGSFLQLKDVFEVLIKFPVLLFASGIYAQSERTEQENKLLMALLIKPLSLGDWQSIATTAQKLAEGKNPSISQLLKHLLHCFEAGKITNWRNEYIGHGALWSEYDESFRQDIKGKLELLHGHFLRCAVLYQSIELIIELDGQRKVLRGHNPISDESIFEGTLYSQESGVITPLSPFVLFDRQGIFFYDSFIPRQEKTSFLDYTNGKKVKLQQPAISSLFSSLSKEIVMPLGSGTSEEDTIAGYEEEFISKLTSIKDYIRPGYLCDHFTSLLDSYSKGVFWLQMERGMGKTMFARGLDPLSNHKIPIDGLAVRAYYVNNAYSYKIDYFTSGLTDLLRCDDSGKIGIKGRTFSTIRDASTLAQNLNYYLKRHREHYGKKQILLIIDGLDEIPYHQGEPSIFDFIPSEEMLEDGVYLLLSSRTVEELPLSMKQRFESVYTSAVLDYRRDHPEYRELLQNYIKKEINTVQLGSVGHVLDKAEYRFLYLKLIKDMSGSGIAFTGIAQGKELFLQFLVDLQRKYGEKYFNQSIRLLCILATVYEPLTLKEISNLMGEQKISFLLLANLIDLRGFIHIERSYRGNLFMCAKEEIRDIAANEYEHIIREIITSWTNDIPDYQNMYLKNQLPKDELLPIPDLIRQVENIKQELERMDIIINNPERYSDDEYEKMIADRHDLSQQIEMINLQVSEYAKGTKRYEEIMGEISEAMLKGNTDSPFHSISKEQLIWMDQSESSFYNNIQKAFIQLYQLITGGFVKLGDFETYLQAYLPSYLKDFSIPIPPQLCQTENIYLNMVLGELLQQHGFSHYRSRANLIMLNAYDLLNENEMLGKLDPDTVPNFIDHYASVLIISKRIHEAINVLRRGVAVVSSDSSRYDQSKIPSFLLKLARTYEILLEHTAATECYEQLNNYSLSDQELVSNWRDYIPYLIQQREFKRALHTCSDVLAKIKARRYSDVNSAITIYEVCIMQTRIYTALSKEEDVLRTITRGFRVLAKYKHYRGIQQYLITLYYERSEAMYKMERWQKSKRDATIVLNLIKTAESQGIPVPRYMFINACRTIALILREDRRWKDAIKTLTEGINFYRSEIAVADREHYVLELSELFEMRAFAYMKAGRKHYQQAIKDYTSALNEINNNSGKEVVDRSIEYHFRRGTLSGWLGDWTPAVNDFSSAIRIIEASSHVTDAYEQLAIAYVKRAEIYEEMEEHECALSDFKRSLDVMDRLAHDEHDAILTSWYARAHHGIAVILDNLDRAEEACTHYRLCTTYDSQSSDPRLAATSYIALGIYYENMDHSALAIASFKEGLRLYRLIAEKGTTPNMYAEMALIIYKDLYKQEAYQSLTRFIASDLCSFRSKYMISSVLSKKIDKIIEGSNVLELPT